MPKFIVTPSKLFCGAQEQITIKGQYMTDSGTPIAGRQIDLYLTLGTQTIFGPNTQDTKVGSGTTGADGGFVIAYTTMKAVYLPLVEQLTVQDANDTTSFLQFAVVSNMGAPSIMGQGQQTYVSNYTGTKITVETDYIGGLLNIGQLYQSVESAINQQVAQLNGRLLSQEASLSNQFLCIRSTALNSQTQNVYTKLVYTIGVPAGTQLTVQIVQLVIAIIIIAVVIIIVAQFAIIPMLQAVTTVLYGTSGGGGGGGGGPSLAGSLSLIVVAIIVVSVIGLVTKIIQSRRG